MSNKRNQRLEALHDALAKTFLDALQGNTYDEDGNYIPPDPKLIKEAREFLKDNDWKVNPKKPSGNMLELQDADLNALPFKP